MTNFGVLRTEWAVLYEAATKAESLAYSDSRAGCFYARRSLEVVVHWLYKYDASLRLPYQDNLGEVFPNFQPCPLGFAPAPRDFFCCAIRPRLAAAP